MGLDPGFSSVGWSIFTLADGLPFVSGGIIHTQKSAAKTNTLATDDNFVRAREISKALLGLVAHHGVRIICAESMSFPRSSSVAAKVAMVWGVLANLTNLYDLPMLQATPQKIKKAVCGKINASKEEIAVAVARQYPAAASFINEFVASRVIENSGRKLVKHESDLEHFWDSCAAVVACQESEHFRLARRLTG